MISMNRTFKAVTVAAALAFSSVCAAMGKAEFEAERQRLEANHDVARGKCSVLGGNARDICIAEARGSYRIAKAELEERYQDSPKARYSTRIAKAEAEYDVAKERCDDRGGAQKEACLREAKAAFARHKADAAASQPER